MKLLKNIIDRVRSQVDPERAEQSYAWHTYEGPSGHRIRIYNATNGDIAMVMSLAGVRYEQQPPYSGVHDPNPQFQNGDMLFRYMTKTERDTIVNTELQELLKMARKRGVKVDKTQLRHQLHLKYAKQGGVFKIEDE